VSSMAGNVSASRKVKILAVENDPEWLGLILRLFSDHVVKPIRYYPDALQVVEPGNMVYDVAIVDLNLIDQPDKWSGDMLGGEVLLKLYENHPSTFRIALTGAPPKGPLLRGLVERYHVDEFFMKGHMDGADLRGLVLGSPAAKAAAQEPARPGVQVQMAEQLDRLRAWAEVRQAQLTQQMEDKQNELRFAGRTRAGGKGAAVDEAALTSAIDRLAAQLAALPGACARIEAMLEGAQSAKDVARASREIDHLIGGPGVGGAG
jgi:hypothetical protein